MAWWMKKRSRETPLPQLKQQQPNTCLLSRCEKMKKHLQLHAEEDSSSERRWDELDHEILVCIMQRIGWRVVTVSFLCKSWLMAILDALFPPGDTLDLRLFDEIDRHHILARRRYGSYLRLALQLRPPNCYTKLLFSKSEFGILTCMYLAERLSLLKTLLFHSKGDLRFIGGGLAYWRNLEEVCCNSTLVELLGKWCKRIHCLNS